MPKPIFIIRCPDELAQHVPNMYEYISEDLQREYHVLIVADQEEEFKFHCFGSDLTEIDLETLKDLVMSSINKTQSEAI